MQVKFVYSNSANNGVSGANAFISIVSSTESLKSASPGAAGARFVISMFATGATSLKSASNGIEGAREVKSIALMLTSSNVASAGVTGAIAARVTEALSFATGFETMSFPAKRMLVVIVSTAAMMIDFAFIFFV